MKALMVSLILVLLVGGCGDDSSSGSDRSAAAAPIPTCGVPTDPGPATSKIVNCLTWPVSNLYAGVRVRINWIDVPDETGYLITVACEGQGIIRETHFPADTAKAHEDILINSFISPQHCIFHVEAYDEDCYSNRMDAGTIYFTPGAFEYCTANPPLP